MRTFVDRVAELRDGSDAARSSSKETDAAAASLLSALRIIDADEEKRLRALITEAARLADAPRPSRPIPPCDRRSHASSTPGCATGARRRVCWSRAAIRSAWA